MVAGLISLPFVIPFTLRGTGVGDRSADQPLRTVYIPARRASEWFKTVPNLSLARRAGIWKVWIVVFGGERLGKELCNSDLPTFNDIIRIQRVAAMEDFNNTCVAIDAD